MERVELMATSRETRGKKVKQLRAEGLIPAVLYGPDTPALAIQADERAFTAALRQAGSTALIDPKGHIAFNWPRVKAAGHAEKVRLKLEELRS